MAFIVADFSKYYDKTLVHMIILDFIFTIIAYEFLLDYENNKKLLVG